MVAISIDLYLVYQQPNSQTQDALCTLFYEGKFLKYTLKHLPILETQREESPVVTKYP